MRLELNGIDVHGLTVRSYSYGRAYKCHFFSSELVVDLSVICNFWKTSESQNKMAFLSFFSDGQVKKTSEHGLDFDIRVLAHTVLTATPVDECLELISAPIDINHLKAGEKYAPRWRAILQANGANV